MECKTVQLPRVSVYLLLLLCLRVVISSRVCGDTGFLCPGTLCCCHDGGTHVNCTRRNLTDVPASLLGITETLDLSFNNISILPADAFRHLPRLDTLILIGNRLSTLDKNVFRGLRNLDTLNLKLNWFQQVPRKAFRNDDLANLRKLHLDSNWIRDVPADAFMNLTALHHLNLDHNQLSEVPTAALHHLSNLRILHLEHNSIPVVPDYAFAENSHLIELILRHNKITHLSAHAFAGLPNLWLLEFLGNSITSIAHTAFRNLPALRNLIILEVKNLSVFPDLTGTTSLEHLGIERCSLRAIPANICDNMTGLTSLNLHNNLIEGLPSLSKCSSLKVLHLGTNKLTSLEGQPFSGLHDLYDLQLLENDISYIPADAFQSLSHLDTLSLSNNTIREIDSQAFAPCTSLQYLDLSNNSFPVLPTAGLQMLLKIRTYDNEQLEDFPPPSELPSITEIATAYPYHCCEYIELAEEYLKSLADRPNISETTYWASGSVPDYYNMTFDINSESWIDSIFGFGSLSIGSPTYLSGNYSRLLVPHNISCRPKPGPFMPCMDLFGSWPLRIGVWLVFLLAIIGNAIVIFVIIVSHTKMDVPRFLICNLAFADFFLGVYLGFLAGVDTSTLGVFRKFGARWQLSAGCRLAGFLAVFSSEFSIYTLSVITLERFYAIKHALHLEKRMKLPHAITVMCFGWIFSVTAAVLPLVNVSHYHRVPVCLPFDVDTTVAKVYVGSILILNILAFVIIMACYASIYLAIQGSHAWNCNDSRVARRMSLLVFTDFACWAPIAFFSLTAAFGLRLISLDGAKVLTIFVLPLNSCANPFLYTILTKQFKKDCKTIMRSLSNRVFRQRSMSRSITLSLGRHPSMRSTQAHQTSQLRWRTNGSISQDLTGDPCLVSFKTENAETSNVYTVSNFGSLADPRATETSNTNGSCSHDHSHSDSSTMLDPNTSNQTLADPRRGSRSPLLDLVAHVRGKTHDYKPKAKTRRKFSIPIPFFSNRSPNKTPAGDSGQPSPARSSPLGHRHKRSHSVTEGLLHKMGRKKPLTSVLSAPGVTSPISKSSERLHQGNNVHSGAIRIIIPQSENPGKDSTSATPAEDGDLQHQIRALQNPWQPSSTLFRSPQGPDQMEAQCLLDSPRSFNDPSSSKDEASEDISEAERLLRSSHDNPVRDQLSSANPSPLLHRPQELELVTVPATGSDNPDCDSGLGTASSPFPDSTEYMKFLPESPHKLNSGEVCAAEPDSQKTKSQGLGSLLVHLTRSEQNNSYNEVPRSPSKSDILCKPRESVV